MKIVLAPDSFKGSLSATKVCDAMEIGVRRVWPNAEIVAVPLADGGEGTLDVVLHTTQGRRLIQRVRGPLGDDVEAAWGILPDGTGFIELAQASGLHLMKPTPQNSLNASTWGTGQLIYTALEAGCRQFLIGLGGSATTDGGSGALSALGFRLYDKDDVVLRSGGGALLNLHRIEARFLDTRIARCQFTVLCDVTNPLYGPQGAASIFSPQKGASGTEVETLDRGLQKWAKVTERMQGREFSKIPGSGAAGGTAFGLLSYCNAKIRSGIEVVLDLNQVTDKLKKAVLVLTGEGRLDEQTLQGKTIAGLCRMAQAQEVPVIALCGQVTLDEAQMKALGLQHTVSLAEYSDNLHDSLQNASTLLQNAVEHTLRSL